MKKLLTLILTIATATAGEIVSWLPNPPDEFVTHYEVYWANNPNAPLPWTLLTIATNTVVTNTAPGRSAYYIVAVNTSGKSDPSAIAVQKPTKPATPSVTKQ